MKNLKNLTIAALTLISLNFTASAEIHSLDDMHEAANQARKAAFIQRRLAINDPEVLAKMQANLNVEEGNNDTFQGEGHKLGGDKYVNRLLEIDHKTGKNLVRLAKKQAHKMRKAAKKAAKKANSQARIAPAA